MKRRRRAASLAAICMVFSMGQTTMASADGETPESSIHYSSEEISSARESARAADNNEEGSGIDDAVPSSLLEKSDQRRRDFRAKMAAQGIYYSDAELDVFSLDDDITLVVPDSVTVTNVQVTISDNNATVSSDSITRVADELQPRASASSGPGMSYLTRLGTGCYTIIITDKGSMLSCWYKDKLVGDGNSSLDWFVYKRKGWGHGEALSYRPDWSVTGMLIRSAPLESYRSGLIWQDFWPSSDFTGDCDTLPIGLAFGVGVAPFAASATISFQDCDSYNITANYQVPGEFQNYMSQGALFSSGDREVGYMNVIAAPQGVVPVWRDHQELEVALWTYPADTCGSGNNDIVCS